MNIEQIYGAEFISIRIGISSSWNIGLQDRFQESLYEGTAHSQLAHLKHVEYVQFYFTGYRVNTNIAYTVFHLLVVEVSCVLFLDYVHWLGQKQNTQNFYHKRRKYGVVSFLCGPRRS